MKIITQEVYHCDYCKKKQFRKCDMSRHEKHCKQNPKNKHKCFDFCKHLVKTEEKYTTKDRWGYDINGNNIDDYIGTRTVFICNKTSQKMYSYIAERKKLQVISEEDSIRMPLRCDMHEDEFVDTSELTFGGSDFFNI